MKSKIRILYKRADAFLKQLNEDAVYAFSAQAAFFIIIALFPFAMFILTLIQYLPFSQNELVDMIFSVLPGETGEFFKDIIEDIYNNASGTLVSVTAISSLWAASSGVYALIRGINSVYKSGRKRNYILKKLISIVYTLVFVAILIVTLAILVFGNKLQGWISYKFPQIRGVAAIVISLRTIVGLCVLTAFFLVLYIFVPGRKTRIRYELPGAVLSAAGWMIFSYIYSFYIDNISNYSRTYGSLAAVVFLMLWLYFCMYIMLVGAEVNVFIRANKR